MFLKVLERAVKQVSLVKIQHVYCMEAKDRDWSRQAVLKSVEGMMEQRHVRVGTPRSDTGILGRSVEGCSCGSKSLCVGLCRCTVL